MQEWPVQNVRPSGESVSPVFEGWYRNPDGTFSLSFGYYSRNSKEAVDVPLGPDNFIEPRTFDGGQPTHFLPQPQDRGPGRGIRHWGVFTITVPEDFESNRVVWTLKSNGATHSVVGHISNPAYELNVLGAAASGLRPPQLRLGPNDAEGLGPGGVRAGVFQGEVGVPLELLVSVPFVSAPPALLRWFKHQGPGDVTFTERRLRVSEIEKVATTTVTFSEAGEYLLRVRAVDQRTEFDRQCCWTNGFLRVVVSPTEQEGIRSTQVPGAAPLEPITFAGDVAPVLHEKCLDCHREGSVSSISLETYEEIRAKAALIREAVITRTMPPWHVDPTVGIQDFSNDASLTDEEIRLLVQWIDSGTPHGDSEPEPIPPLRQATRPQWALADDLGPPDLVVRSSPYSLAAEGQDQWWESIAETGLSEDRWIRALEVRPSFAGSGRRNIHHVTLFAHADGRKDLLTEWAVGKGGEVMPSDTGRPLKRDSHIGWEVHYSPVGVHLPDDQVALAIWLYPRSHEPIYRNQLQLFRADPVTDPSRGASLEIPPGQIRMTQGVHVLPSPARIESFQPHMHLRGKAMSMEAITPDGRRAVLSHVDRFQHNWQISYRFAEEAMPILPAGTILIFTAWHDNTASNLSNPDPSQWVGFGRRTVDEMAHAWVGITYLDETQFHELHSTLP